MVFLTALFDETRVCVSLERHRHLWMYLGRRNLVTFLSTVLPANRGQGNLKRQWGRWDSWKTYLDTVLQTAATDGTPHPARTTEPVTNQEIPSSPSFFLQDHSTLKETRKKNFEREREDEGGR